MEVNTRALHTLCADAAGSNHEQPPALPPRLQHAASMFEPLPAELRRHWTLLFNTAHLSPR